MGIYNNKRHLKKETEGAQMVRLFERFGNKLIRKWKGLLRHTREIHKLPKTCEHGSIAAYSVIPSRRSFPSTSWQISQYGVVVVVHRSFAGFPMYADMAHNFALIARGCIVLS
jgi:hypothetical protein